MTTMSIAMVHTGGCAVVKVKKAMNAGAPLVSTGRLGWENRTYTLSIVDMAKELLDAIIEAPLVSAHSPSLMANDPWLCPAVFTTSWLRAVQMQQITYITEADFYRLTLAATRTNLRTNEVQGLNSGEKAMVLNITYGGATFNKPSHQHMVIPSPHSTSEERRNGMIDRFLNDLIDQEAEFDDRVLNRRYSKSIKELMQDTDGKLLLEHLVYGTGRYGLRMLKISGVYDQYDQHDLCAFYDEQERNGANFLSEMKPDEDEPTPEERRKELEAILRGQSTNINFLKKLTENEFGWKRVFQNDELNEVLLSARNEMDDALIRSLTGYKETLALLGMTEEQAKKVGNNFTESLDYVNRKAPADPIIGTAYINHNAVVSHVAYLALKTEGDPYYAEPMDVYTAHSRMSKLTGPRAGLRDGLSDVFLLFATKTLQLIHKFTTNEMLALNDGVTTALFNLRPEYLDAVHQLVLSAGIECDYVELERIAYLSDEDKKAQDAARAERMAQNSATVKKAIDSIIAKQTSTDNNPPACPPSCGVVL